MTDAKRKTFNKWLYAVLVALGVGGYQAARLAGCESGIVDDASGECIEFGESK